MVVKLSISPDEFGPGVASEDTASRAFDTSR
jgi:hypothetical protein